MRQTPSSPPSSLHTPLWADITGILKSQGQRVWGCSVWNSHWSCLCSGLKEDKYSSGSSLGVGERPSPKPSMSESQNARKWPFLEPAGKEGPTRPGSAACLHLLLIPTCQSEDEWAEEET